MYNWKNVQYANSSGILSAMNEADKQAAAGRQQMVDALSGFGDDYSKIQTDKAVAALSAAGTPEEAQSLMQQFSQNNSGWIDQTSLGEQYRDQVNDLRSATEFDATMKHKNAQTALTQQELDYKTSPEYTEQRQRKLEADLATAQANKLAAEIKSNMYRQFITEDGASTNTRGLQTPGTGDTFLDSRIKEANDIKVRNAASEQDISSITDQRANDGYKAFNEAAGALQKKFPKLSTADAKAAVTTNLAANGFDASIFKNKTTANTSQKQDEVAWLNKVVSELHAIEDPAVKAEAISSLSTSDLAARLASAPSTINSIIEPLQRSNEIERIKAKFRNSTFESLQAAFMAEHPDATEQDLVNYMKTQDPLTESVGGRTYLTEAGGTEFSSELLKFDSTHSNWQNKGAVEDSLKSAFNYETSIKRIAAAKKNKATEVKEIAVITNNNKKTLKDNRIKYSVNSLVNKTGVAKAKFTEVLDIVKNNAGFYKDPQNTWILIQAMDNVAIVDEDTLTDDINSNRQTGTITDFFMDTDPEVFAVDVLQEANRLRKVYADGGHTLSTGTFVNEPLIVMTPDQMTAMDKSFNKFKAKAEANAAKKKKLAADAAKPQVVVPAQQNEGILEQFFNSDLTGNPM